MAEIIIIAAIADNNVIGRDNDIPWHIKEDFLHFKELTMGNPCVMGDRTYESLPKRPLPGRENIVLSLDENYSAPGATVFNSFEGAVEYLGKRKRIYICGGATIYRLGLAVADTLELTRVHMSPEGDTCFPEIDFNKWDMVKEEKYTGYSFLTYRRKS